jgi:hypothetical protein
MESKKGEREALLLTALYEEGPSQGLHTVGHRRIQAQNPAYLK